MVRTTHRYRFGEFEVEPGAKELRRSGRVIHLEPKVFQVLICLIENPGRVVEKSELLDLAWNETYITDNALTKAIGRLRQALGDDAQDARFIQTVHSVGYRFIADVEEISPEAPGTTSGTARRRRLTRLWLPVAAVLLIVAIAVIAGLRGGPVSKPGQESEPIRSLAVLPLQNLTGNPDEEYLAGAIHDTLIGELSRRRPLRVISRQSTLRYRDVNMTAPEIASELDVDALVEGSVMRSGERVRVTAQLIRGADDEHLWSGSFDGGQGNVLQLVSDVAEAIADEIHVTLAEKQATTLRRWRLPSPEAEDSFLRARYFLSTGTRSGLARAAALFDEIIELDPGFAPAWAGRGGVSFLQGMFGHIPHSQAAAESARTIGRALELDPDLPEALSGIGMVRLYFEWDWPGAGEALARAIELHPHNALIRHGYGDFLLVTGRLEESLEQVELGRRYDPASPIAVVPVAGHLMLLGRFEEAADLAEDLLAADPDIPVARSILISARWELGEHAKALELLEARWRRRDPQVADALIRGRHAGGPAGAMLAVGEALAGRASGERPDPIQVAEFFARGGDADRAFEFLDRAFEERLPALLHVSVIPSFRSLHADPRFSDLLERIGLPSVNSSSTPSGPDDESGPVGGRSGSEQANAVGADQ